MKIFYTTILTMLVSSLSAQSVTISGPGSSAFGDTKLYTVSVSGINLSQADIGWDVSSGNSISIISDTQANVTWNRSGTQSVTFEVYVGNDYYSDTKTVTVSAPPVATPSAPQLITNGTCSGQATLRRVGSPPSGVTWYWQGKNSNGTSRSLGSGEYYYPNSSTGGSGYYYLRARNNSSGTWSNASARSPYVTIGTAPNDPSTTSSSATSCDGTAAEVILLASSDNEVDEHIWYTSQFGSGTTSHTVVTPGSPEHDDEVAHQTKVVVSTDAEYWVAAKKGSCISGRERVTATVQSGSRPGMAFEEPASQPCEGTTFEIGVGGGVNSTFVWYDRESGGSSIGSGTTVNVSVDYTETTNGSKSFWVGGTLRNAQGCTYPISPREEVVVEILPLPGQVNITSNSGTSEVPYGESGVGYSASGARPDANYSWSISPTNAATLIPNGSSLSINFDRNYYGPATISVSASNSCGTTTDSYPINVLPPIPPNPTLTAEGTCSGQATLRRVGSPPSGVTWYWQGKNSNGTSRSLGSGEYYYPNSSTGGSGYYYLRARNNSSGTWSNASARSPYVTIGTAPNDPSTTSSSATSCDGTAAEVILLASSDNEVDEHIWYTSQFGSGTTSHTVVTPGSPEHDDGVAHQTKVVVSTDAEYWVAAKKGSCISGRERVTATVQSGSRPGMAFEEPASQPCEGTTFEIGVGGGVNSTFVWYDRESGGSSIGSGTTVNVSVDYTETTNGSKSFWVGGTLRNAQGCTYPISPREEVVVEILPLPGQVNITSNSGTSEVPYGESGVGYSASGARPDANYSWSISPTNAATLIPNGSSLSINFDRNYYGPATISVSASNSCGTTTDSYPINVLPPIPPNPTLTVEGTCSGQATLRRVGSPPSGVTWYWQGQNPEGENMTSDSDEDYNANNTTGGSGRYYIRAYHAATSSWSAGSGRLDLTTGTAPNNPSTASASTTSCDGTAAEATLYAFSDDEVDEHIWYISQDGPETVLPTVVPEGSDEHDAGVALQTKVVVSVDAEYWVAARKGSCESGRERVTATVHVGGEPIVGFDIPGLEQCEGTTFEIGVGGGVNSTYEWYEEPSGEESHIGSGTSIEVNLAYSETTNGFKSFWVGGTLRNAQGCTYEISPREEVVVSIALPVESVIIEGENNVCVGIGSVSYIANATHANDYVWTIDPPSAGMLTPNEEECIIDLNPDFSGAATLSVVASNNGCTPKTTEHLLNVSPITDTGNINGSTTKYGVASGSIVLSDYTGNIVKWQSKTPEDLEWDDILSSENPYSYENIKETTLFRAVVKSGVCSQEASSIATITILDVSFDFDDCETIRPGQNVIISVSSEFDSYQWLRNGTEISGETSHEFRVTKPGNYSVDITSVDNGTFTTGEAVISSQLEENQNTIITYGYRVITPNVEDLDPFEFNTEQQIISANIFDGLGRSIQQVALNSSSGKYDVIIPQEYDEVGRQDKNYLPYVDTDLCQVYRPNAIDKQLAFYHPSTTPFSNISTDEAPFAKTRFERSSLNRPLEQGSPGVAWQPDPDPQVITDKVIHYDYESNSILDAVLLFETEDLGNKQLYVEGTLYKNTTTDEDGNKMVEYTNKRGQVVLKESSTEDPENPWATTYYIYDDFDQLRVVLPPEASSRLDAEFFGQTLEVRQAFLDRWAFQYEYDGRGRMTSKKVPGAAEMTMIYDRWDRLVLTQDGNQLNPSDGSTRHWLFTKYDHLNRPVMTGLVDDYTGIADDVNDLTRTDRFESFTGSGVTMYSNSTTPTTSTATHHTITYYDDYSFRDHSELNTVHGHTGFVAPQELSTASQVEAFHLLPEDQASVKGQVTGTKTKLLGTSEDEGDGYLETITYYDNKYRVIQVVSENHLGGIDVISTQYDFVGNVRRVHSTHSDGTNTMEQLLEYEYDHANRLMSCDHTLNEDDPVRLYTNEYNELGELVKKHLHQEQGSTDHAQTIDYDYNIRGWLKSINESGLSGSGDAPEPADLFHMELIYNAPFATN